MIQHHPHQHHSLHSHPPPAYDEYDSSRGSYHPRVSSTLPPPPPPLHQRGLPSPPSFYSVAPPPPPPAPSSGSDGIEQQHYDHMYSQHRHVPPPSASAYYPAPPHPYLAHYPPPPPPAMGDPRERAPPFMREEYVEHPSSYAPYDFQRHYTHANAPATQTPISGLPSRMIAPMHAGTGFDANRINKNGSTMRSSISDGHAMAMGDQQPTYVGHIKSANDAILLLSACDLLWTERDDMLLPPRRVTRRLLDAERADLVASGSVFVWDEREAGMKRWTDGRVWSASRVSGCFLTYRELEARKKISLPGQSIAEGPATNQYKPDGLIKQSFSITTTSGRKLHVISYFTKRDIREGRLRRVSEDPRFVGEGGGEWGLKVDEKEYSFPDFAGRAPVPLEGTNNSSHGAHNTSGQGVKDDDSSDISDLSEHRSPSPRREVDPDLNRKRQKPDDDITCNDRAPSRPRLTRLRSSSMSGMPSAQNSKISSSTHSNSSLATTIPYDCEAGKVGKDMLSLHQSNRGRLQIYPPHARSSAIRALVSPTLPKESALRGSACEMKPTQSQDCANAVGALLSLAGNGSSNSSNGSAGGSNTPIDDLKGAHSAVASSPLTKLSPSTPNSPSSDPANTSNVQQATGLGLNVKPLPKRRDLDRVALNKFNVRL